MSYFGRNIRKIRNAKNISQSIFADLFNLKRGSIGAYEEGRAEAKIDTVIEIAEYFQLSLDQLLKKELTINEIYHLNERSKRLHKANKKAIMANKTTTFGEEEETKSSQKVDNRLLEIEQKLIKVDSRLTEIVGLLKQERRV